MGTSNGGLAPFSPSDVDPNLFGAGGNGIVPGQGIPAMGPLFIALLQRIATPVANVAALQATVQADRADSQLIMTLDTYTLWSWENASTTAASATVIEPSDVTAGANSGNGRYVAMVAASGSAGAAAAGVQVQNIALTLTNVNALGAVLSGTIAGVALPTNARFLGTEQVIATEAAGNTTLTAKLGNGTTADAFMEVNNLMQVAGTYNEAGSAVYVGKNIGGITPTVTLTSTVTDLNATSAIAATIKLFYFVQA